MRIAYLGYDILFPCLEALEACGCSIMKVFSFRTDDVFEFNREVCGFAQTRGIPFQEERITLEDIHHLKRDGCEAIFCGGYIYKVPIDHSIPIVNVHPALLPLGRGPWPMPVTILRGLTESGVTLHKMEASFDTGDILLQRPFPVGSEDNLETVTEKVRNTAAELCRQMAPEFRRYWTQARPQGQGEYWPEPAKRDYTITAETTAEATERILRAFFGYECFLQTEEVEYPIVRGQFRVQKHDQPFGKIGTDTNGGRFYYVNGGIIEMVQKGDRHHR